MSFLSPNSERPTLSPSSPAQRSSLLPRLAIALCAAVLLAGSGALAAYFIYGKPGLPAYKQETPDDVIKAALDMVKAGRADALPTLIYAESPEMRSVLNRLGGLFGSLQDLSGVVTKRFPQAVERYKKEAREAVTGEKGKALLNSVVSGRDTKPGASPEAQRSTFEQATLRIVADPFSWLSEGASRLTTVEVADDQAAILFDGAPLAGVGVTMKRVGGPVSGKWFIELPVSNPLLSRYMPQTRNEWQIVGNLIKVLDNAFKDLSIEVKAGKISRPEQLAEKAGEMAFPPAAMVAIVYAKELDVRQRRETALADFRKRLNLWTTEKAVGNRKDAIQRVSDAIAKLAVEELDKLIRADFAVVKGQGTKSLEKFAPMENQKFEATVEGWLLNRGVRMTIAQPPADPDLTRSIEKLVAPAVAVNRRR